MARSLQSVLLVLTHDIGRYTRNSLGVGVDVGVLVGVAIGVSVGVAVGVAMRRVNR